MKKRITIKDDFCQLDQLIGCHFNQDYLYINDGEDTIEGIVCFFKKTATENNLQMLKKEILTFIEVYHDDPEAAFEKRYGSDFSPSLWETTAYDFLQRVLKVISNQNL